MKNVIAILILLVAMPTFADVSLTHVQVRDKEGDIKNITGESWRLVYDGEKVIALIEGTSDSVTSTSAENTVQEFNTEEEALDKIKELKLEYVPLDKE